MGRHLTAMRKLSTVLALVTAGLVSTPSLASASTTYVPPSGDAGAAYAYETSSIAPAVFSGSGSELLVGDGGYTDDCASLDTATNWVDGPISGVTTFVNSGCEAGNVSLALSTDGTVVLIGVPPADNGNGAVYIYNQSGGTCVERHPR